MLEIHVLRYISLLFLLFVSACSQEVATQTASPPTAVTEAPVLAESNAILYRGGAGRTGNFNLSRIDAAVEVQWQQEVGPSVHGSPLLVGNTLLVPTVARRFVALDVTSGEEKWTFEASGDLFSSPAVMDEVVYIGNENGDLYALDLDTGSELWSLELGSGIWTAPLVVDENVYVGSETGSVYAVNTETHQIRWEVQTGGWVMSPAVWRMALFSSAVGRTCTRSMTGRVR